MTSRYFGILNLNNFSKLENLFISFLFLLFLHLSSTSKSSPFPLFIIFFPFIYIFIYFSPFISQGGPTISSLWVGPHFFPILSPFSLFFLFSHFAKNGRPPFFSSPTSLHLIFPIFLTFAQAFLYPETNNTPGLAPHLPNFSQFLSFSPYFFHIVGWDNSQIYLFIFSIFCFGFFSLPFSSPSHDTPPLFLFPIFFSHSRPPFFSFPHFPSISLHPNTILLISYHYYYYYYYYYYFLLSSHYT